MSGAAVEPVSPWSKSVVDRLRDWERRAAAAAEVHFQVAEGLSRSNVYLGIPVVVLSAIVGTGVFATLTEEVNTGIKIAAGTISVIAAVLARRSCASASAPSSTAWPRNGGRRSGEKSRRRAHCLRSSPATRSKCSTRSRRVWTRRPTRRRRCLTGAGSVRLQRGSGRPAEAGAQVKLERLPSLLCGRGRPRRAARCRGRTARRSRLRMPAVLVRTTSPSFQPRGRSPGY
jgi:hypothetical protein